jgi:hypothetical protein
MGVLWTSLADPPGIHPFKAQNLRGADFNVTGEEFGDGFDPKRLSQFWKGQGSYLVLAFLLVDVCDWKVRRVENRRKREKDQRNMWLLSAFQCCHSISSGEYLLY